MIQYMDANSFKDLVVMYRYVDEENTKLLVYDQFFEELKTLAYDITLEKLTYKKAAKGAPKPKQSYTIQVGNARWDKTTTDDLTQGEYIYKVIDKGQPIYYGSYPKTPNDKIKPTILRKDSRLYKKTRSLPNWFTPQEYYKHYLDKHKISDQDVPDLTLAAVSQGWSELAKKGLSLNEDVIKKNKDHLAVIKFAIDSGILKAPGEQEIKKNMYKKYPLLQWVTYENVENKKHIKHYIELIDKETQNAK